MLKLYGGLRSRASIVQWYLEELSIPYEFVCLDMQAGEHKQPEFLAINPMGKVPAIADGDFTLWESGAILLYLAEKYGQMPDSLEQRAQIAQWVLFANATLGSVLIEETNREQKMPQLLTPLNQIFESQSFLMGEEFSVIDVAVGSVVVYAKMLGLDLSQYPALASYVQRLLQRPAFDKTIAQRDR